jgi:hypothetical protein
MKRTTATLSIAGALACLALAPTAAHASQGTSEGGGAPGAYAHSSASHDIDDVVALRKEQMVRDLAPPAPPGSVSAVRYVFAVSPWCDIPPSLDDWSRRLIAVQVCARTRVVPVALARVGFDEPAAEVVGHCGHETLHQPSGAAGLPVSEWFTPTSC